MNTNRISDAGLRQTPGTSPGASPGTSPGTSPGDASAADVLELERSLNMPGTLPGLTPEPPGFSEPPARADKYGHPPPGEPREEAAPPPEGKEDENLASLMRGLFAEHAEHLGAPGAPSADAAREAHAASAAPRQAEMVERLVEQILVSHPNQPGDSEVRLMVRNSLLPDTEIRLTRGTDGLLSVTLATGRNDAFQTLVAAQAELKQALDARENREVRLIVVDTRDAGAEEGRSDQRSRGYTAYDGDGGDAT
jgi:type III secretion system needle length determinant